MPSKPRLAFVIDALPAPGGAEKVFFTTLEAYPHADVFTLIYNRNAFDGMPISQKHVRTSYLNKLPFDQRYYRLFLPLMPKAIQRFDLREYDLIVSFNYAVAHGVHNPNGARHLSYTYLPMRYAWSNLNLNGTQTRKHPIIHQYMKAFQKWDRQAASRVDAFAAVSLAVTRKIKTAWGRESHLVYPPVEIERFHPIIQHGDYYITISRLVPHKRIDLLVQAFSQIGLPLIVVGDGPERSRLQAMASSNVKLPGYLPDTETAELLAGARGFVCAAEEDFGIAIVEAQAAGCPVIAYGQGGALESVQEGITGIFFDQQTVESLCGAIQKFEDIAGSFCSEDIVANAQRFGKERFLREFRQFVEAGT
jgi:glycosyltransferase involved in cell wall biosynthesis